MGLRLGLELGLCGGFDFGHGLMRGRMSKPFKQNDEGGWWKFLAIDFGEISPRFNKLLQAKEKKKCHPFLKKIISYSHFTN